MFPERRCYLDNAASSIPSEEVIDTFNYYARNVYGNSSSVHELGMESRRVLEVSKGKILNFLNGHNDDNLIFTSCASEANSIGIQGILRANKNYQLIVSKIEHEDILLLCDWIDETEYYNKVKYVEVDNNGLVDTNLLKCLCKEVVDQGNIPLVIVQGANSEIGVIQDLKEISRITHVFEGLLFSDITQLLANSKIDVSEIGIDLCTASSQKVNCIKGSGFLYAKAGIDIKSVIFGNQGIRGGTPDIPSIAAFCKAIELLKFDTELLEKRNWMIDKLFSMDNICLNGSMDKRLNNNINICITGTRLNSAQLVSLLSLNGFYVSAGSACSSHENKPSHVLKAIGLTDEQATKSIRISLNHSNDYYELEKFINCLKNIIKAYRI